MSFSISLDTYEYYEQLREYRDSALKASNWHGRRINIGGLVIGNAVAGWRTKDDGIADLQDVGLRFRSTNLTRIMPTTLRIINSVGDIGREITTYKMDLDDVGIIEVYRNMFYNGGLREAIRASYSRNAEIEIGLHYPTYADSELIYTELQRGASGKFLTTQTH